MPTIAAIATPVGTGGVGVIRISGPDALAILGNAVQAASASFSGFKARFLHHGWIRDASGERLDECLAVYMPGPATFTGEDVAEIHCHGSPLLVQLVLERCLELGARQAERGEFSRRAFLNGRLDLSQAEAVAELVSAPGRESAKYSLERLSGLLGAKVRALQASINELNAQACVAVDFPDDEIPGLSREEFIAGARLIIADMDELLLNARRAAIAQSGSRILLLGPVNAGKSSLLNALLGRKRALVSDTPGTTRDFLEESLDFDGLSVRLLDTAGLRKNSEADPLEALGMQQSLALLAEADLVWLVLDGSGNFSALEPLLAELEARQNSAPLLFVLNKRDLPSSTELKEACRSWPCCSVSALTGEGLGDLIAKSRSMLLGAEKADGHGLAPNARQASELEKARREMLAFAEDLEAGQSYDAGMVRLDAANAILDNILGLASHEELLDKIFSQFCIGK